MRKVLLTAIIASMTIVFSSCSNEENTITEFESPQLLKSFKIKKDARGKYYVDFDLSSNAKIDKIYDSSTESNKIFLYSSDVFTEKSLSEEYNLNNTKLKIDFVDTNVDYNSPSITITDDNISLAKGSSEQLTNYEIMSNEDGSYQLNFSVADNVDVDFVYNDSEKTYEIHLEQGKSNSEDYSRNFIKEEGELLKIDFVNHITSYSSKSEILEQGIRKPKIIID